VNIVQVVDNLIVGGAQKWIVTFAGSIYKRGNSRLVVISLSDEVSDTLIGEIEELGALVRVYPFERLYNPQQFIRLVKFFRQERFDIIQTHLIRANIIGKLAGLLSNTPAVSTLHSTGESAHRYNPLRTRLETFVMRYLVKRIIAVGFSIAEFHSKRFAKKSIDVIPNAITPSQGISATERFDIRSEIATDACRTLLISVGRISPPKGYQDLLMAIGILRITHPDVLLVIVGNGSLYDEIAQQVISRQLGENVIMLGERTDVPRLLCAADVFVSASHREGLPLAILEAMGAGLPIVATSVGDIPQVIDADRGIIVPPHQPMKIADALGVLLDNSERWESYGEAGKAYIRENHHPDVWLNKLMALYGEMGAYAG